MELEIDRPTKKVRNDLDDEAKVGGGSDAVDPDVVDSLVAKELAGLSLED